MDLFAHKDILKVKEKNTIEVRNPATQEILAYIKKKQIKMH